MTSFALSDALLFDNALFDGTELYPSNPISSFDFGFAAVVLDPTKTYQVEVDVERLSSTVGVVFDLYTLNSAMDPDTSDWAWLGEETSTVGAIDSTVTMSVTIGPGLLDWDTGTATETRLLWEVFKGRVTAARFAEAAPVEPEPEPEPVRVGGRVLSGSVENLTIHAVSAAPAHMVQLPQPVVAEQLSPLVLDNTGHPVGLQSTPHRAQVMDRWRLIIDGKDVTYFRGAVTQIEGWQLQEPYAFGPGTLSFPQMTPYDVRRFGKKGPLRWMRPGARVSVVPVVDGVRGPALWGGVITTINATMDAVNVQCDGAVSGRMTLRQKTPPVFTWTRDIGRFVFDACKPVVTLKPYLGPKTGIRVDNRSSTGPTQLEYVNGLLAEIADDGSQWTIRRTADGRSFQMSKKDTATVHATVFLGASGIKLDVTRDIQEEPNVFYGTGTDPRGMKWIGAKAPELLSGPAPAFPADAPFGIGTTDADVAGGITALHHKLEGHGYLTRSQARYGTYGTATAKAVRRLQRDARLPVTGVVNAATWRAAFNVGVTDRSLKHAFVAPLAIDPRVQKYRRTANGSIAGWNRRYDKNIQRVERAIDHGAGVWKSQAADWSEAMIEKLTTEKNWFGTLEIEPSIGVFAGDVDADTVNPTPISVLDLREGWNLKVVYFDGPSTLFHIAGINFTNDPDTGISAKLAIDTRSRDLLVLGHMIERYVESRRNRAREFVQEVRRGPAFDSMVIWSELGGILDQDRHLVGGQWNRIEIPAGQEGDVGKIITRLLDDKAQYVLGVSAWKHTIGRVTQVAGDPFGDTPKWHRPKVQNRLKKRLLFLYTAGQKAQPLGYYPGKKYGDQVDDDGNPVATGNAITGRWEDEAGFHFVTQGHGVLYLWIFPDRDCTLQAGRIMRLAQSEGA